MLGNLEEQSYSTANVMMMMMSITFVVGELEALVAKTG